MLKGHITLNLNWEIVCLVSAWEQFVNSTHIQGLLKGYLSLTHNNTHKIVLYMYVTMPYISMHIHGCMPYKVAEKNWMTKKGASFSMAQNYRFSLYSDPLTLQHWAKKNYHLKWEYYNYSLCQKDGWQFGQQYPAVSLRPRQKQPW